MINNEEIILATVKQNGNTLKYASDELKNDKNIMLAAIQQNGLALEFASEELQNDKDVVLIAIQQDIKSLYCASKNIINKIGNNDPIKYLQSALLQEKLNKNLINNNQKVNKKKYIN